MYILFFLTNLLRELWLLSLSPFGAELTRQSSNLIWHNCLVEDKNGAQRFPIWTELFIWVQCDCVVAVHNLDWQSTADPSENSAKWLKENSGWTIFAVENFPAIWSNTRQQQPTSSSQITSAIADYRQLPLDSVRSSYESSLPDNLAVQPTLSREGQR